ncbi:MAG: helix-turn-helix transcriptional regulator [Bacteroidales bacterium]|nr:helix-turn-helix transcriptional regulator [Bacteroidales bacterium]
MQSSEIKKLLLDIKTETGLTQAQIAEQIGSGRTYISDLASGRASISPEMLNRLLAFLPSDKSRKYRKSEDNPDSGNKNSQVIENNSGTAINGDNAVVHPQMGYVSFQWMQDQINELRVQNGKLLDMIDRLTSK